MLAWHLIRNRLSSSVAPTWMFPLLKLDNQSLVNASMEEIPTATRRMKFGAQPAINHVVKHAGGGHSIMHHVGIHTGCAFRMWQHVERPAQGAFPFPHHVDIHSWNLAIKTCARSGSRITALYLFQQLQQEGILPEKLTLTYVLIACGNQDGLHDGKQIHVRIASIGFRSDPVIHTALVSMYGKHSMLDEASGVFDQMIDRDVVAWSTFIAVLTQQGSGPRALQSWNQMLQEGLMPDKVALVCILDAHIYASEEARMRIHAYALFNMQDNDVAVGTALVTMFGKSDNLAMAMETFDKMLVRNVLIWSAIISVQVRHAQRMRALQSFNNMQQEGILPNEVTFLSVVAACIGEKDLAAGHRLHARLVSSAHEMGVSLSNSLLNLYTKCGNFEDAASLFETLPKVDVISFTAMIAASVRHGNADNAFCFLNKMILIGHVPDPVAFTSLLEACNSLPDLTVGKCVHAFILECGFDSELILANCLLNMYCKCRNLMDAHWIFEKMVVRDIISWNAIIGMHSQLERRQDVLQLLHQMQQEVLPDRVTILNTISCFTDLAALPHGKRLHTQVLAKKLELEVRMSTALVSMYGRCGNLSLAQRVFSEERELDLVLWRELFMVYAYNGLVNHVKSLLSRLFLECFIPDEFCFVSIFSALHDQVVLLEAKHLHVYILNSSFISDVSVNNALLNLYGRCGGLQNAQGLFNRMLKKDSVSWNTLLSVHNLHSQSQEVVLIQEKMCWEGYLPDVVTWTCRLAVCVSSIHLLEGKRVHACLCHCALDTDGIIATALLNMYGKCGNLDAARRIFDSLAARNLVSWNTMIAVYAQHGRGERAVQLFDLMLSKEVSPDEATFASILAACSHAGLHGEVLRILACMENHGFSPSADDVSCIIDLLGRLGRLDEAESLLDSQLENATVKSLRALLSACRHQRDVERGERAAERVFSVDSDNAAAYVLLSNLYVHDNASIATVAGH